MAEERKEGFFMFKVKTDASKRWRKEELKNRIPFSALALKFLNDDEFDGDEINLAKKINEAIHKELEAVKGTINNDDYTRAKAYEDTGAGQINELKEFFAADDEFGKKVDPVLQKLSEEATQDPNLKDLYEQYLNLNDEIEKVKNDAALSDAEKNTQIAALEQDKQRSALSDEYKEALDIMKDHREKSDIAADWIESLEGLDKTPPKVMANLVKFYKDCCEKEADGTLKHPLALDASRKEGFEKIYENFTAEKAGPFAPSQKDGRIINEHNFGFVKDSTGNEVVKHSIFNLKDTGLNICWIGDEIGLVHGKEELTSEQLSAFAEYCFSNGVNVEQAGKLETLKIVDKDGNLQGMFMDEFNKEMTRLQEEPQDILVKADAVRNETEYKGSFYDFLPPEPEISATRAEMVDKSKKRIGMMGFRDEDGCLKVDRGWNTTIISVYASDEAKRFDNEIDKNGKRTNTKEFSVELSHTIPPKGRIYIPPGKKPSADMARTFLDAAKAAGSKYFVIPGADKIGKDFAGEFMKASVKTKMIPFLKSREGGKGCDFGAPDLEGILKALSEEPMTPHDKSEYLMRLSEQLDKYMGWKPGAQEELGSKAGTVKQMALFEKFNASYVSSLEKHIIDGVDGKLGGKEWDKADEVSAIMAMTKIIQDISKGKLNGKPYNPLADNEELLKNTFDLYMKNERTNAENAIHKALDNPTNDVEQQRNDSSSARDRAVSQALRTENEKLAQTLKEQKANGVEISIKITPAKTKYDFSSRTKTQSNQNTPSSISQNIVKRRRYSYDEEGR